jgi:hypothetical protein
VTVEAASLGVAVEAASVEAALLGVAVMAPPPPPSSRRSLERDAGRILQAAVDGFELGRRRKEGGASR